MHRIKIYENKVIILKNIVYLKQNNKVVVIKNVIKSFVENGYLYFSAQGNVDILFNNEIYRYFNLIVKSENFNLKQLKERAINDILNNLFYYQNCFNFKRYISFVTKVLNIEVTENGVYVKPNLYKFSYCLIYKINNKIKRVNIV